MSLMIIFLVKPRTVLAKSLGSLQLKMINENGNYRIYRKLTRKGPAGSMGLARTFKYGNFQANAVRKVGKSKYYYVWIDGHKAGLINELS